MLEAGANVESKIGRRYHLMDEAVLTREKAIISQVADSLPARNCCAADVLCCCCAVLLLC